MDISLDPLVWDFTEAVRVLSRRNSSSAWDVAANALRRQPSIKERAPSNGAYQGADLNWCIPSVNLVGTGDLKPGDRVVEEDGTEWVALTVEHATFRSFWRLYTINLCIHHDLRDLVEIQEPTITYDAAGGPVRLWPDGATPGGRVSYAALAAKVQKLEDTVVEERGLHGFNGSHAIYLSQEVAITKQARVKFEGQYFDIRAMRNPLRLDEVPVLDADLRA